MEIRELSGLEPICLVIKNGRLRRFGHIGPKNDVDCMKRSMTMEAEGSSEKNLMAVADPGGQSGHAPRGPWPDWPLSNCKLTSLTSFFCCDHHNNKRRLRFTI